MHRRVVFLDGADFDTWYSYYDEDGGEEAFRHLLQWEYGDDIPLENLPSWSEGDQISIHMDGPNKYVVAYNWNCQYVSLTEIVEE